MPAKAQPRAAMRNERTTAGPAFSAAAMPESENKPAPMIEPMPRAIKPQGPRWRLRLGRSLSASRRRSRMLMKRFMAPVSVFGRQRLQHVEHIERRLRGQPVGVDLVERGAEGIVRGD